MIRTSRIGFLVAVGATACVAFGTAASAQTQAQKNAIEAAVNKANALRSEGKLREAVTATEVAIEQQRDRARDLGPPGGIGEHFDTLVRFGRVLRR